MATSRLKTIEYAFQSRNGAALAAATRYDFGAITLYIPETGNRSFFSVRVQVFCRDAVTSATTLTSPLVGIKLGGVAFSDTTLGNPPANTGESGSYFFERDVTAYFNSNFGAGGSQTCQVGVSFAAVTTANIGAKLIITYYSDEQQTRVKTVHIPLDSGTGALTASLAEIGTNQVPRLDTFLPESSKTIRRVWFELWYNESTVGTANDASLGMQVNSETEHLTGIHESGLASSCMGVYFWEQTAATWVTSGAVAAFKLRSSTITTASTFNHVGIVLCVTYEYDHTNSSTILNSLVIGMAPIAIPGATSVNDTAEAVAMDIMIGEPATITLVQSGALIWYSQSTNVNPVVLLGEGSGRTYTDAALLYCGASFLSQRIDSGGAGGAGFTIARGRNRVYWQVYIGSAGITPAGFMGLLLLNYTSGKHASGDGVHNHSVSMWQQNSQASGTVSTISAAGLFSPPEAEWFMNDLLMISMNTQGAANSPVSGTTIFSESGQFGFFTTQGCIWFLTESELGVYPVCLPTPNHPYRRWTLDPKLDAYLVDDSLRWRIACSPVATRPLAAWMTYHSITKAISGTVSGSAGGTVTLRAYRDVSGRREEVQNTSRSGNGAYSLTWFDDVESVFVEAREDATHTGRSESGVGT